MGMEQPSFTDLDKSFQDFLGELQKTAIPEYKRKEIEQTLKDALISSRTDTFQKNPQTDHSQNLIHLDLNKLNKRNSLMNSTYIKHSAVRWFSSLAIFSAGLLFITIGFILIVTPATPEFEIATIFYFNEYDGFTVMDLFALVIIFIGIYLFIRAFIAKEKDV
ncbi:MAG: hypothetical protein EAZ12_07345 [Sphingobacteriia bacterium]|nr:MAG: hypothetical protein EAZ12_07345 [Sphingobacteriia bacterium]